MLPIPQLDYSFHPCDRQQTTFTQTFLKPSISFYSEGGDDVQQLCEAGEEEFLEIMALVGMASKPLHVRRLQKALQEWVSNPREFNLSPSFVGIADNGRYGVSSSGSSSSCSGNPEIIDVDSCDQSVKNSLDGGRSRHGSNNFPSSTYKILSPGVKSPVHVKSNSFSDRSYISNRTVIANNNIPDPSVPFQPVNSSQHSYGDSVHKVAENPAMLNHPTPTQYKPTLHHPSYNLARDYSGAAVAPRKTSIEMPTPSANTGNRSTRGLVHHMSNKELSQTHNYEEPKLIKSVAVVHKELNYHEMYYPYDKVNSIRKQSKMLDSSGSISTSVTDQDSLKMENLVDVMTIQSPSPTDNRLGRVVEQDRYTPSESQRPSSLSPHSYSTSHASNTLVSMPSSSRSTSMSPSSLTADGSINSQYNFRKRKLNHTPSKHKIDRIPKLHKINQDYFQNLNREEKGSNSTEFKTLSTLPERTCDYDGYATPSSNIVSSGSSSPRRIMKPRVLNTTMSHVSSSMNPDSNISLGAETRLNLSNEQINEIFKNRDDPITMQAIAQSLSQNSKSIFGINGSVEVMDREAAHRLWVNALQKVESYSKTDSLQKTKLAKIYSSEVHSTSVKLEQDLNADTNTEIRSQSI